MHHTSRALLLSLLLLPTKSLSEIDLEDFAARLICAQDPSCDPSGIAAERAKATGLEIDGRKVPTDTDMSQLEIQRALLPQGRYLTTSGQVLNLDRDEETPQLTFERESIPVSDHDTPEMPSPAPFIIDPAHAHDD